MHDGGEKPDIADLRREQILQSVRKTCGSELARDSGVSGDIDIECQAAIASKLAPTGEPVPGFKLGTR